MTISLGNLPIWRGALGTPYIDFAPFGFDLDDAGLVRLHSPEIVSRMIEAYSGEEYHFITSPPGSSEYGNRLARVSLGGLTELIGEIRGLDVLELGGGTTWSASYMLRELGARSVTIIDPAVRADIEEPGLFVRREYFTGDTAIERRYPLVVSFNTLEHVPDPLGFVRAARRHLADDGRMYLKLPDSAESLEVGDLGLCVHEHLSYFTPRSLDAVLRRAGFEIVGDDSYKGGLQVLARPAPPNPSAHSGADPGQLERFRDRAVAHVQRLTEYATDHAGTSAAFVGASVGLANVLHLSGAHDWLDVHVYDGDSLKSGQFLPGIKRPIRLSTDSSLAAHDCVFVAPFNFYEEIRGGLEERFPGLASRVRPLFSDSWSVPRS